MSKVKIYVTAYIKPEFIQLQYETFKRHCRDEYEIIIINNAYNEEALIGILNVCNTLGLQRIDVIKTDKAEYCSQSHCVAIEYALQNYIKKDTSSEINVIMDSDIFAFAPFSFKEMMNGKQIAGMYQQRQEYEYIAGIIMMFNGKLDMSGFSFHGGRGDTGGAVNILMKKYNIVPEWIRHTAAIDIETDYIFKCNDDEFPYKSKYGCQFLDSSLIHYYRGSNWRESDITYHNNKYLFIKNLIDYPEKYCINLDENVCYEYAQSNKGYDGVDHNYNNYRFKMI